MTRFNLNFSLLLNNKGRHDDKKDEKEATMINKKLGKIRLILRCFSLLLSDP